MRFLLFNQYIIAIVSGTTFFVVVLMRTGFGFPSLSMSMVFSVSVIVYPTALWYKDFSTLESAMFFPSSTAFLRLSNFFIHLMNVLTEIPNASAISSFVAPLIARDQAQSS